MSNLVGFVFLIFVIAPNNILVIVHYDVMLSDGTKFDTSHDQKKQFEFTIGVAYVIHGWDIGVSTMKKGEKSVFSIKPQYAYGEESYGEIPSNSTLTFVIQLVDWEDDDGIDWEDSNELHQDEYEDKFEEDLNQENEFNEDNSNWDDDEGTEARDDKGQYDEDKKDEL